MVATEAIAATAADMAAMVATAVATAVVTVDMEATVAMVVSMVDTTPISHISTSSSITSLTTVVINKCTSPSPNKHTTRLILQRPKLRKSKRKRHLKHQ